MTAIFSTLKTPVPDTLGHGDTWRTHAACRAEDPDLFFPVGETGLGAAQAAEAKRVCFRCPVMDTCLRWAMDQSQQDGIWGGLTARERHTLRRRQAKAARRPETASRPSAILRYATDRDAYDAHALAVDGHIEWDGPNEVRADGVRRSPNQVAWRVTRNKAPVGQVLIDCDHDGCIAHLTDRAARDEHARLNAPPADPKRCGTVSGYRLHRRRGEKACGPCREAKNGVTREQRKPVCGTRKGYRAHRSRGEEACAECRQANADRRLRNTGTALQHTPGSAETPKRTARCGTNSGYHAHRRQGTPPCEECRTAHTAAGQKQRQASVTNRPPTTGEDCGTASGHRAHLARNEAPCQLCTDAKARARWILTDA
uniref:WhiB family transcriptional regulator n=1 Tax=Streptomyces halstedii TaxID=1944 RepID=UPI003555DCAD